MTDTTHARIGTLMLIDDSRFDQMVYKRIAERSGLVDNLLQFDNAPAALEYLTDSGNIRPELILLDVNMPQMDGFEFLEAATEKFGTNLCPIVVMLTTSLNPKDEERARRFEVVRDFLNKPLTQEQLSRLCVMLSSSAA